MGGRLFISRDTRNLDDPFPDLPRTLDAQLSYYYRTCYVVFEMQDDANRIEFIPELDHPKIFGEAVGLMTELVEKGKVLPLD
jgi:hypothetical protein